MATKKKVVKSKGKAKVKAKEVKVKAKAKAVKVKAVKSKGFEPDYDAMLDSVEKKFKLSSSMSDRMKYAISSGCLVQDLILGGGYIGGGMYTYAGAESSGKSTNMMNFLSTLIKRAGEERVRVIEYIDAEGSFDPKYFSTMSKQNLKIQDIFGIKNAKGAYIVKPLIRYYAESRGEGVMDALNSQLKRMPDMELLNDSWYYVYENTKENRSTVGSYYSKELFSKYNKFYVKTEKTAPQAIVVVDSWVSLVPEKIDDEDVGAGLGVHGRFFADNLPKIKSKLRRKNVILIGANQLREKPMSRGDPRYEPGGNALKFQSDCRIWQTPRVVPHGAGRATEEEPSVVYDKGHDLYRYIHLNNRKNKLATPYLNGWMRLHVKDAKGKAHGIDKVWDVFKYLQMTGQVSGNRKKLVVQFDGGIKFKAEWLQFKALLMCDAEKRAKVAKKCGMKEAPKLYSMCLAQLKSGKGTELYYSNLANLGDDDID